MIVTIEKCKARVRDVRGDDVKSSKIKEKEKENICLLYLEMFISQNLM